MERFDVSEVRQLGDLVARAESGDEVVITRDDEVAAKVVVPTPSKARKPGKINLDAIRAVRALVTHPVDDGAALIRQIRDESER